MQLFQLGSVASEGAISKRTTGGKGETRSHLGAAWMMEATASLTPGSISLRATSRMIVSSLSRHVNEGLT